MKPTPIKAATEKPEQSRYKFNFIQQRNEQQKQKRSKGKTSDRYTGNGHFGSIFSNFY